MPDTSGHDATRRDDLHTMTLAELEGKIAEAGIVMSRRQIMRHCKAGTFDAQKIPAANNIEEWFIAPASVDKGIADIKTLQSLRSRHDATRRDTSDSDGAQTPLITEFDTPGHDATRRDMTRKENSQDLGPTGSDTSRHVATDLNIFEHPYVKKLEHQVEKWEGKYQDQVRRTEEIQLKSQEKLLELQRMTTIGQSKTLAEFMLQAKEWITGEPKPLESHDASEPAQP
jgi:hypothetical protein